MRRRRICMVTGSRAEYGHAYWLLKAIREDPALQLQLVVTGIHLAKGYGSTYRLIEKDGFKIDKKLDILRFPDTDIGTAKSVGLGCGLFSEAFAGLKPDILLVFGDRYEILAAVIAAYLAKIPIAHVHGGETSQGLVDEAFRHSITKMSSLHFVAAREYAKRVVQLGEAPSTVYHYGAPGLDNLQRLKLLNPRELGRALGFDFSGRVAMVTYHPVTLEKDTADLQIRSLLRAVKAFDLRVIFSKANADAGGGIVNRHIERFCRKNPARYRLYENLGQQRYFSCLKHADVMIGNSSSGLVEAPSFRLPVVDIGDRQKGRIKAANIINCGYGREAIERAIRRALSAGFRKTLRNMKNPYYVRGDGKVSRRIKERLKKVRLETLSMKKEFYDIP